MLRSAGGRWPPLRFTEEDLETRLDAWPTRLAVIEDLEVVTAIVARATLHMNRRGVFQWDTIYPDRTILRDDILARSMYLIEVHRTVAGFATANNVQASQYELVDWRYSGQVKVVHRLTIDPTYQRMGLATRLMESIETGAVLEGYGAIRLDAFTGNQAALRLYEGLGYRRAGTVSFQKGEFYCYEKTLGRPDAPSLKR